MNHWRVGSSFRRLQRLLAERGGLNLPSSSSPQNPNEVEGGGGWQGWGEGEEKLCEPVGGSQTMGARGPTKPKGPIRGESSSGISHKKVFQQQKPKENDMLTMWCNCALSCTRRRRAMAESSGTGQALHKNITKNIRNHALGKRSLKKIGPAT